MTTQEKIAKGKQGRSIVGSNDYYQLREDVSNFGDNPSAGMDPSAGFEVGRSNTFLWWRIS